MSGLVLSCGVSRSVMAPGGAAPAPIPRLVAAPSIIGDPVEGASLVSDQSDIWEVAGSTVAVDDRDYRLLLDGSVAVGPQAAPEIGIPPETAGALFRLDLRVRVGSVFSDWVEIASGSIAASVASPSITVAITGSYQAGQSLGEVAFTIGGDGTGTPPYDIAGLTVTRRVGGAVPPGGDTYVLQEGDLVTVNAADPTGHPAGPISVTSAGVTVAAALVFDLTENASGEAEIDGASGEVTLTVTSPAIYAGYDAGNGPGVFVFNTSDLESGPINLVPPDLVDDGTPDVGEALAVSPALWVYDGDNADPTITYQWLRNGSAIPGAEASTYDLVPADASATISVTEVASGSNGTRSSTSLGVSIPTSSGTINAVTATDPGGITIDYTGTLNIIAPDPSGARAEAN